MYAVPRSADTRSSPVLDLDQLSLRSLATFTHLLRCAVLEASEAEVSPEMLREITLLRIEVRMAFVERYVRSQ